MEGAGNTKPVFNITVKGCPTGNPKIRIGLASSHLTVAISSLTGSSIFFAYLHQVKSGYTNKLH